MSIMLGYLPGVLLGTESNLGGNNVQVSSVPLTHPHKHAHYLLVTVETTKMFRNRNIPGFSQGTYPNLTSLYI